MKAHGFSLIEIPIAIAVLALLGAGVYYSTTAQAPSAGPATASSTSETTEAVSVPGMSKYTDTDFGFSFWYPANWPLDFHDPSSVEAAQYPGGDVSKFISVGNSVTIAEVSSAKSITDDGDGSVGPVTYWFDVASHSWMRHGQAEFGAPDEAAVATSTADVTSFNSMGGIHVFSGSRSDTYILPLSAHKFLVIYDGGRPDLTTPLVRTVLATDPSAATPVSAAGQTATIKAEQTAYASQ